MTDALPIRAIVDKERLPDAFPTHAHSPEFWEHLGRAVGTFGVLEQVLGKAIFALTGSRPIEVIEPESAQREFQETFRRSLTDTLNPLIDSFGHAVREHPQATIENLEELLAELRDASRLRNVLCHGAWQPPDSDGRSIPFFVDTKLRVFHAPVDIAFLSRTQRHAAELVCEVISVVSHMGYQFPGSNGPGTPIW